MSEIGNPVDLHGRVLPANQIRLMGDGNKICALVGHNLAEGVSGWGDSVHEALREGGFLFCVRYLGCIQGGLAACGLLP